MILAIFLYRKSQNQTKNIPGAISRSPIKVLSKSVQGFLSYDQTNKQTNKKTNKDYSFIYKDLDKDILPVMNWFSRVRVFKSWNSFFKISFSGRQARYHHGSRVPSKWILKIIF